jgi:GNAT superfamily N-acetyltransferase
VSVADWTVRAATTDDVPAIIALFAEVAREGRWIATEWPFDVPAYEERYRNSLLEGRMVAWIATAADLLAGQLSAHELEADEPQVGMFVAPAFRGHGIGRALVDAVSAWAGARGARALGLRVYPDNVAARALYRATGFVEVAFEPQSVPRRDGSFRDALYLRKTLA